MTALRYISPNLFMVCAALAFKQTALKLARPLVSSLSHSLSLSLSPTHSLSLSLSLTHTHMLSLSYISVESLCMSSSTLSQTFTQQPAFNILPPHVIQCCVHLNVSYARAHLPLP